MAEINKKEKKRKWYQKTIFQIAGAITFLAAFFGFLADGLNVLDRLLGKPSVPEKGLPHPKNTPSDSAATPPDNYLYKTMEQVIEEIQDKNLTDLQRNNLINEYTGKSVQWKGIIQNIASPLIANEAEGVLVSVISPLKNNLLDAELVLVRFLPQERISLNKMHRGSTLEFQGRIESFFINSPTLDRGKVIRCFNNELSN